MKKNTFNYSILRNAIVIAASISPTMALAADELSPSYGQSYEAFLEESKVTGGLFYFQRQRERIDGDPNNPIKNGKYQSNLSHSTTQAALNFNSGYAWDTVGVDIGGFGAYDLAITEGHAVNVENEFSFAGDKWGENNKDNTPDAGFSLATAMLKMKFADGAITAKAGLTQLYVPGIIGVNWSYQPGSYRGAQIEGNFGNLYLTYAIADQYKAPWYKETQDFYRSKAWGGSWGKWNDKENKIDYIHGLAARYQINDATSVTAAVGQSENYMDSYHLKVAHKFDVLNGLNTSYQFYGSSTDDYNNAAGEKVETYDGLAWQQAITAAWSVDQYSFRLEGLFTKAEGSEGNYLPRLTRGYANSQGANEIWWDSRSDWNANNEKALFFGATRTLDDLVGAKGWTLGVSGAYGWGIEGGDGSKAANGEDTEWAANFDVMYTVQDGKLQGTLFKLHYTDYNNDISQGNGWTAYPNIFASERDVKFHIVVPLQFM